MVYQIKMIAERPTLRFPNDFPVFLFWVLFRPSKLIRDLCNIDPELVFKFDFPFWTLWKKREIHPELHDISKLALFNMLTVPFISFWFAFIFHIIGFVVNWYGVLIEVVLTILISVFLSFTIGILSGVIVNVTYGMTFGIFFGMSNYLTSPIEVVVLVGIAVCGIVFHNSYRSYAIEAPIAWLRSRSYRKDIQETSQTTWNQFSSFPNPKLTRLLVEIGLENRQEGMEAIAYTIVDLQMGYEARQALIELIAYDISNAKSLQFISEIAQNLGWLPDDTRMDMKELLLGIEQVSQHARAALKSETLYNRQEQLRKGAQVIDRIRSGFAYAEKSVLTRQMIPALESWKRVFGEQLADARLKQNIPNVYVSGTPLIKDSKVFKGRRDLFRALENELLSPADQRPTLMLFGARRMGKTSTIKQFPIQIGPQIVPVSVDLQKIGTVGNVSALLSLVVNEIIKSANLERHLRLHPINKEALEKDPYLAFQEWLASLDEKLGDYYWVLLALDEFEALGTMLEDKRVDERIFQMLRGVIQHHPRITILMSGAHTLEELPPLWSNYFINTKYSLS
jgi:hypothetical protein